MSEESLLLSHYEYYIDKAISCQGNNDAGLIGEEVFDSLKGEVKTHLLKVQILENYKHEQQSEVSDSRGGKYEGGCLLGFCSE
jgi:hypothetical protein